MAISGGGLRLVTAGGDGCGCRGCGGCRCCGGCVRVVDPLEWLWVLVTAEVAAPGSKAKRATKLVERVWDQRWQPVV